MNKEQTHLQNGEQNAYNEDALGFVRGSHSKKHAVALSSLKKNHVGSVSF